MKIEFAQHYESLESGRARFWRAGWIADYPDPENFLDLLYGVNVPDDLNEKSYINSVRYKSEAFDAIYSKAKLSADREERTKLFLQCDQIALDDAAIIPIYYNIYHRLLQPYVKDFPQNPMEHRSFEEVYFVP
mgnify:FL=1